MVDIALTEKRFDHIVNTRPNPTTPEFRNANTILHAESRLLADRWEYPFDAKLALVGPALEMHNCHESPTLSSAAGSSKLNEKLLKPSHK